ncbi:zinc finger protein 292b [Pimephales promelas]|nr:zinc finger protein 292b [Pimephales promelas]
MADEEAEQDRGEQSDASSALNALATRLEDAAAALRSSQESPAERASQYCYEFCQDCKQARSARAHNCRTTTTTIIIIIINNISIIGGGGDPPFCVKRFD